MYCVTQGHSQTGIAFVYTSHVYWKMGMYQNATHLTLTDDELQTIVCIETLTLTFLRRFMCLDTILTTLCLSKRYWYLIQQPSLCANWLQVNYMRKIVSEGGCLRSIHTGNLLGVNYSLNNELYCSVWVHSHLPFFQLLRGIKSSIMGRVPSFLGIAWTEKFTPNKLQVWMDPDTLKVATWV